MVTCGACTSVYLWCGHSRQVGSKLREVLKNAKEVNEQRLYQDQKKVSVAPSLCEVCSIVVQATAITCCIQHCCLCCYCCVLFMLVVRCD